MYKTFYTTYLVHPEGLEPSSMVPKTIVLSTTPWVQIKYYLHISNNNCYLFFANNIFKFNGLFTVCQIKVGLWFLPKFLICVDFERILLLSQNHSFCFCFLFVCFLFWVLNIGGFCVTLLLQNTHIFVKQTFL